MGRGGEEEREGSVRVEVSISARLSTIVNMNELLKMSDVRTVLQVEGVTK